MVVSMALMGMFIDMMVQMTVHHVVVIVGHCWWDDVGLG
jgi:hypothetical protein